MSARPVLWGDGVTPARPCSVAWLVLPCWHPGVMVAQCQHVPAVPLGSPGPHGAVGGAGGISLRFVGMSPLA